MEVASERPVSLNCHVGLLNVANGKIAFEPTTLETANDYSDLILIARRRATHSHFDARSSSQNSTDSRSVYTGRNQNLINWYTPAQNTVSQRLQANSGRQTAMQEKRQDSFEAYL